MKHIAIIVKGPDPDINKCAKDISDYLMHFDGIEVTVMGIPNHPINPDCVITIGGDGTLLHTVAQLEHQVPIIGINKGTVGFLADVDFNDASVRLIESLIDGSCDCISRMRIDAYVNDHLIGTALNDLAFARNTRHFIEPSIVIDGVTALKFRGDGLIIATPTGSTAYSMSAGGPIVDPRIDGYIVTPIAPYLLSARPQIIAPSRDVLVKVSGDWELQIDGEYCDNEEWDTIRIKKSLEPALFIDCGRNFFEKVNTKLRR